MPTFKFSKVYETLYCADIEADNFEEAKQMLGDAEWEQDDEPYLSNSYAQEYDEDGDLGDELEWEP